MANPTGGVRVVSLLPSATDTVIALKLQSLLVGRSHECDQTEVQHVAACTSSKVQDTDIADVDAVMEAAKGVLIESVYSTACCDDTMLRHAMAVYNVDLDLLKRLKPDVILTQLQDGGGHVEHDDIIASLHDFLGYDVKVVHLAAANLGEVWQDMQSIACALNATADGEKLVKGLQQRMNTACAACRGRRSSRVAFLQWLEPLFAGGGWVREMVSMVGGEDVITAEASTAPLHPTAIVDGRADVMVFAICGMTMSQSIAAVRRCIRDAAQSSWSRVPAVRNKRLAVLDGTRMFSRPGPLLAQSLEVLVEVLHPEAQPYGHCGKLWTYLNA